MDLKSIKLFPEKKKHHAYRCKIMRGVQKWHPFGLKIYRIWSIFVFKSYSLQISELVSIIFYDFLSISIDFTMKNIPEVPPQLAVFTSLTAPRSSTERSQTFPEYLNLVGRQFEVIMVPEIPVLKCEIRKCQIIYYIKMR